jgi:hypothetical protein
MGISWRREADLSATVVATSRWTEAAQGVTERFQQFDDLPLDDAVDAALMRAPGNMSREELTRRIAASREANPPRS